MPRTLVPRYKGETTVGRAYGDWTVLTRVRKRAYKSSTGYFWECVCKCGTKRFVSAQFLREGRSTRCSKCRWKEDVGQKANAWKGYGAVPGKVLTNLKPRRGSRTLQVNIDCKYLDGLWSKQQGKCAYTGRHLKMLETASVDRINSNKGYIRGNVHWVHVDVNKAKWTLSHDQFIDLCVEVAEHNRAK